MSSPNERGRIAVTARNNKAHLALSLPAPPLAQRICAATALELRLMLANREISSADAVIALAQRAHSVGLEEINAVTEEFYDEALDIARRIDAETSPEKWKDIASYPLLGVPVSIKDGFHQLGAVSSCGMAVRCVPIAADGLLVTLLREAGAIPFVRTNTPQCLMLPETMNNVWGTTSNPYNKLRTPGGSSGGEGALIAAQGSPLGLGGDIGGSIRIPAHFCGIVGFKPTPSRVSRKGMAVPRRGDRNGQLVIPGVAGPMARSVQDCGLMMRALLVQKMFESDPYIAPLKFDSEVADHGRGRALRIGMFVTDNWFQPCAAQVRAVREAADALRRAGHEIVPIELDSTMDGWKASPTYYAIMGADGNMKYFTESLEGEELHPYYQALRSITNIPNFLRAIIRVFLGLLGEQRKKRLVQVTRSGGLSFREYHEHCADVVALRARYIEFMAQNNLDALLCPALALPALPHGYSKDLTPACSYTFLFNTLMWPSGTVPVTTVQHGEGTYYADAELPADQRDSLARHARLAMAGSEGLPVSVQVATPPHRDELCLFVMREIEKEVGWKGAPPA